MLLIMCGYPYSGKSTFLDLLLNKVNTNTHLIRPSDWYEGFDGMSEDDKSEYQIACWEHAIDKVCGLVASKPPTDLIILDTCGASPRSLGAIINVAKSNNHKLCSIFIATPISICCDRGNKNVVKQYIDRISNSVKFYNRAFDVVYVVKHDTINKWTHKASEIATKL